jgi:hypothetical protein
MLVLAASENSSRLDKKYNIAAGAALESGDARTPTNY